MIRRCTHCGKKVYRNYRLAAKATRSTPIPGRVYWHPQAGGYCITHLEMGEYHARRALGDSASGDWDEE